MSLSKRRKRRKAQPGSEPLSKTSSAGTEAIASKEWRGSRAGARAGRGFRYQEVIGAALLVSIWSKDQPPGRVIPEGLDDLVLEYEDGAHRYMQVKSRQAHRGPFTSREVASHLVDGWARLGRRLRQSGGALVLVLEQSLEGLQPGEYELITLPVSGQLRPLLEEKVTAAQAQEIVQRSSLWICPDPERVAIDRLAGCLGLPGAHTIPHLNELRSAIGKAADKNASAEEAGRVGLSITDVTGILDRVTGLLDEAGLLEAVSRGICEAVDLLTPIKNELFYQGVDVTPGHVAAGLTVDRPEIVERVDDGLRERRTVLVVGPSGSGKSAILWMVASENRRCRWYRVRRLDQSEDVDSLVSLARALLPNEGAPVGFIIDNVGQVGTKAWDALVQEMAMLPDAYVLGAAREEDLYLLRTLPRLRVVRLEMSETLAEAIYEKLRARNQTEWQHWREPYEQSKGLLLEYLHLLNAGKRLQEVIEEQVQVRRRGQRELETSILAITATAATWGAEVSLSTLLRNLNKSETVVSAALQRLVREHLLQQRLDGTITGLHRLRSRAIYEAIHNHPPPTEIASITATLPLLTPVHLHSFLLGVLSEDPRMVEHVVRATATRLASDFDPDVAIAIFHAFRIIEFRQIAQSWLQIFDEEHLPPAKRPIATRFAVSEVDFQAARKFIDARIIASLERLAEAPRLIPTLRAQLLWALPRGWAERCLVAQRDCQAASGLLANFQGLAESVPELKILPNLTGSPLEQALQQAGSQEVADVIATGRGVSIESARRLAAAAGGVDRLLVRLEGTTPWCRNLRTGAAADHGLLDGKGAEGLSPNALVARVEFRYVSDLVEQNVHGKTVDLARTVMALHPDLELVHAVAVDARARPNGFSGLDIANMWLKRESLHMRDQVAWNRSRIDLVESMVAAANQTDLVAAELDLFGRTARLIEEFGALWILSRRGNPLSRLNAERRALINAVDAIPPAPAETSNEPDPVQGLLRVCLENIIPRLAGSSGNMASVSAFIADKVSHALPHVTEPQRWRLLGYNQTPDEVARFAAGFRDLGAVASEIAFGDSTLRRLEREVGTVERGRKLSKAAEASRRWAESRFHRACSDIAEAVERSHGNVKVVTRPAARPTGAWPPIDVLFAVHLERLDKWGSVLDALTSTRHLLSDIHQVAAVPMRGGVPIAFLGRSILRDNIYPWDEHAWEDWRPSGASWGKGACFAFRQVIAAAVTLSSFAALPGGPRPGLESEKLEKVELDLQSELEALGNLATEHPNDIILAGALGTARDIVQQALQELAASDATRGDLARWALNRSDGIDDNLSKIVNVVTYLLVEWDISPEAAAQWYAELVVDNP